MSQLAHRRMKRFDFYILHFNVKHLSQDSEIVSEKTELQSEALSMQL